MTQTSQQLLQTCPGRSRDRRADVAEIVKTQAGEVGDLSPGRRSRYLIDLAAAHAMRRQTGEAIRDLTEAETIAPEQTRTHRIARDIARDLLQLSGLRPRPKLRDLAERFGIVP